MRIGGSGLSAGALAVLTALGAAAQIYGPAVMQGSELSASAAEHLESSLQKNPHDLNARAHLVGYYSAHAAQDPAMRGARLRQIEWLIKNEPATLLLRNPVAKLTPADFSAPYGGYLDLLRSAWQEQIDRRPEDAVVIENAVRSLGNAEVNSSDVGRMVGYLKRLRVLEPGDPEWALELAGLYALKLPLGMMPSARADAKQFAASARADLEHSGDAAVVGLAGIALWEGTRMQPYQAAFAPILQLSESLLRRATALNPKNPGWARVLDTPVSKTGAQFGKMLTDTVEESDLWPGGTVPAMSVPPGAVSAAGGINNGSGVYYSGPGSSAFTLLGPHSPLQMESLPPTAIGADCSVRFDGLIGRDGRVKNLQVTGFEHLNIPFVAVTRDAVRQMHFEPVSKGGQPVDVATHIDITCPKKVLTPTKVEKTVPPSKRRAAGGAGGVPGGGGD